MPIILTSLLLIRTALASPYFLRKVEMPRNEEPMGAIWSKLVISVFLVLAGGAFAGWVACYKNDKWCEILRKLSKQIDVRPYGIGWIASSCFGYVIGGRERKEKCSKRYGELGGQISMVRMITDCTRCETQTVLKLMQKGRHWVLVVSKVR